MSKIKIMSKTLLKVSKKDQKELFEHLKKYRTKSTLDIAVETDYSFSMVNYVMSGVSYNRKIIAAIFESLKPEWEDEIPARLLTIAENLRDYDN